MIINSVKEKDDYKIYNAQFFKGGDLKDLPKCFIVEKNGYFAHGETLREAIEDVTFKYFQDNSNLDELVSSIKAKGTITVVDYRLLTGACQMGCNNFMEENNITADELPIEKVLELTKGYYGHDRFVELLG